MNREILLELKLFLVKDGVHLNDMAGRNVVTSIIDVFSRMGTGKLKSEGGLLPVPIPVPHQA
jgi:hypothetical protein